MKAIMISIRPEWVEKILNNKKILETRKTTPKCKLPCKVYIYCCNSKKNLCCYSCNSCNYKLMSKEEYDKDFAFSLNGKVVAEFTLNKFDYWQPYWMPDIMHICDMSKLSCVSVDDLISYSNGKVIYGWHIDNLKIYDKPKELNEFSTILHRMKGKQSRYTSHLLQRPPQSWCYVEDLEEV